MRYNEYSCCIFIIFQYVYNTYMCLLHHDGGWAQKHAGGIKKLSLVHSICICWFKKDLLRRYIYNRHASRLQFIALDVPLPTRFFSISAYHIEKTVSYEGKSRREIINILSSSRTVTDTSVRFHPIRTRRQISTKIQSRRESCERTERLDEANSHRSLANALKITNRNISNSSLFILSSKQCSFRVKTFMFTSFCAS